MSGNDRRILAITMFGHGMVHAYELAIPILIPQWMAAYGTGAAAIGLAVAVGYALFGIGAVPGGIATDRWGSKRLISACLVGMGVAFLLLGLAGGIVGITAALVVWGIAASVYHPAGLRLISTGVRARGTAFGYHGIAGNFGIALGPLLAAVLLIWVDWQLVVVVLGIPGIVGGLLTARLGVDELAALSADETTTVDTHSESSLRDVLTSTRTLFAGGFAVVFPIVVLEGFYYRGMLTFLPDILAGYPVLEPISLGELSADPSNYVYVGILLVGMLGQYVGGRLSDRVRLEPALVGVFLALGVVTLLFVPAATAGLGPLLVASAVLGFVLFAEQPITQSVVAEYSGTAVRGLSYGYMFLGVFGVGALGAAVSGAVLSYTTEEALFLLLAIVPTVAGVMGIVLAVSGDAVVDLGRD